MLVTNKVVATSGSRGCPAVAEQGPTLPVVLGEAVFDRHDR